VQEGERRNEKKSAKNACGEKEGGEKIQGPCCAGGGLQKPTQEKIKSTIAKTKKWVEGFSGGGDRRGPNEKDVERPQTGTPPAGKRKVRSTGGRKVPASQQ